jgi:ABC-type lipoprotein export system ATPase subunit
MSIRLENVVKAFGNPPSEVIKGVSFEVKDGEFVSLTGKSGSGKSTLLYMASSLDNPTSGKVLLQNQDIQQMEQKALHRFRNQHMGFIFQYHYLLPEFTALENVLMPAIKAGVAEKKRDEAIELLERFELGHSMNYLPSQLSGGESQRVAIARALIMQPRFIFADEPTGALDSANAINVMQIFQEVNRTTGCTIVYVTHDAEFAAMAHRQILLVDGQIESITANKATQPKKKRAL